VAFRGASPNNLTLSQEGAGENIAHAASEPWGLLERPGGLEIAVAASREHLPELSAIKKGQPLLIRRLVPCGAI